MGLLLLKVDHANQACSGFPGPYQEPVFSVIYTVYKAALSVSSKVNGQTDRRPCLSILHDLAVSCVVSLCVVPSLHSV